MMISHSSEGIKMQQTPLHLMSRTNAPETSRIAAGRIRTKHMKQFVLREVQDAGQSGITCKELLARHPHIAYSSITARPADLERDGYITYRVDGGIPYKRDGARVMFAVQEQL